MCMNEREREGERDSDRESWANGTGTGANSKATKQWCLRQDVKALYAKAGRSVVDNAIEWKAIDGMQVSLRQRWDTHSVFHTIQERCLHC